MRYRIFWHQHVEGKTLLRWHTGTQAECDTLALACKASGEKHWISGPNNFK
jgi:hypothetical protein